MAGGVLLLVHAVVSGVATF